MPLVMDHTVSGGASRRLDKQRQGALNGDVPRWPGRAASLSEAVSRGGLGAPAKVTGESQPFCLPLR